MDKITLRLAIVNDLEMLANLNKQLIEDEKHDNKMNLLELKERMKIFINTEYKVYIFEIDNAIIGYALVNHCKDPLYLRHFFICREVRRLGYGTAAFNRLMKELNSETIDIEVMSWNERAIGFWKSLGFHERSIYMRRI